MQQSSMEAAPRRNTEDLRFLGREKIPTGPDSRGESLSLPVRISVERHDRRWSRAARILASRIATAHIRQAVPTRRPILPRPSMRPFLSRRSTLPRASMRAWASIRPAPDDRPKRPIHLRTGEPIAALWTDAKTRPAPSTARSGGRGPGLRVLLDGLFGMINE